MFNVYNRYTDTAGNLHFTDCYEKHGREHTIRADGGAGMSVPKTVLAEMAGVDESEVRCDNCGRGDTGILVDCRMWGSVVAGGGFCSMWCKREEVQE